MQTDLLRRPTGLAVGLARKEPAPPPSSGGLAPKTWFPRSRGASKRSGLGVSVIWNGGSVEVGSKDVIEVSTGAKKSGQGHQAGAGNGRLDLGSAGVEPN